MADKGAQIINLEDGQPTVEEAITRLKLELATLRHLGVRTIKVIHGYGSSGEGGSIRQACRVHLRGLKLRKSITAFCPGEHFGPFEQDGRDIAKLDSSLRKDPDWARQNDGITVIYI